MMITDDDDDVDYDAGREGGGQGDSSSSVTPLQLSSSTNNTLQNFRHRFPLFSARRRPRPCRTRLGCRQQQQWLPDGRSNRRDELLQQIQQYANNTFNIIY